MKVIFFRKWLGLQMTFEVDQTTDTEQSPNSLDTRDITQNQKS